jgi:hypothetical protein
MSQHIWKRGSVEVRMGYDRPLDFVFCTLEINGEMEYSNLSDENAGTDCQDVTYYRDVLRKRGVFVPDEMLVEVGEDQVNRVGNKVKLWEDK